MLRLPSLLLFCMIMLLACSKKKQAPIPNTQNNNNDDTSQVVTETKDFLFIPVDQVKWVIRCTGGYIGNDKDTAMHHITTVTSNNTREYLDSEWYYTYSIVTERVRSGDPSFHEMYKGTVYLREDTLAQLVRTTERWPGQEWMSGSGVTLYFNKYKLNDTVSNEYIMKAFISSIDSLRLNGKYYKKWNIKHPYGNLVHYYNEGLFLSYGVGSIFGILGNGLGVRGNGGEIEGLDFIYKSDSIHFSFDYVFRSR